MTRLRVLVEGQTEELFVDRVLGPHLFDHGYVSVRASRIGITRRGGICAWQSARTDILASLRSDRRCLIATLVDFYGMPANEAKGWPGRAAAARLPTAKKGAAVTLAMTKDIARERDGPQLIRRFVPFVTVHEFECWLFTDCQVLANRVGDTRLGAKLRRIRDAFDTPEDINDSPQTAPSKRLQALIPGYQKLEHGLPAAEQIGLATIRRECPTFDRWLGELEQRGKPAPK